MKVITKAKLTIEQLDNAKMSAEMANRNQCGCVDTYCC